MKELKPRVCVYVGCVDGRQDELGPLADQYKIPSPGATLFNTTVSLLVDPGQTGSLIHATRLSFLNKEIKIASSDPDQTGSLFHATRFSLIKIASSDPGQTIVLCVAFWQVD